MSCNDKISNICDKPTHAKCVDAEHKLHGKSSIESSCYNQHEVNEDVARELDQLLLEEYSNDCFSYTTNLQSEKSRTQQIVEQMSGQLCTLQKQVEDLTQTLTNLSSLDITNWNLNAECLVDPCGDNITTLGQLIQIMINKDCE